MMKPNTPTPPHLEPPQKPQNFPRRKNANPYELFEKCRVKKTASAGAAKHHSNLICEIPIQSLSTRDIHDSKPKSDYTQNIAPWNQSRGRRSGKPLTC
jgi:ribosomal protein S30